MSCLRIVSHRLSDLFTHLIRIAVPAAARGGDAHGRRLVVPDDRSACRALRQLVAHLGKK